MALLIGVAGAVLAELAAMPLPYLLGPLVGCGTAAVAGVPVAALPHGRELGQAAVGLAIGLRFVPEVVVATARLLPVMALATGVMILATTVAALLFKTLGGVDRKTAFFATAAAGLAEMAAVARREGANGDVVAVVQLVRVTAIVTTVPFLVTLFGAGGAIETVPVAIEGGALSLVALLALAAGAAFLARPLGWPNSWLLVPAAVGALVAGLAFGPFAVPQRLLTVAQIVIGVWLGCRLRRELLAKLPRVTVAAFATTAFLVAAAAALAALLSVATGLPFVTSLLAVAPAGVAEMVLTATAMHLDATTVTAFQVMRIAVVTTTILIALRAYETLSQWLERIRA